MKNIKNDCTEQELIKTTLGNDFIAQVKFVKDEHLDLKDNGYYLYITRCFTTEINENGNKSWKIEAFDSQYESIMLLVNCQRRGEKCFNKAIELFEEKIETIVNELEYKIVMDTLKQDESVDDDFLKEVNKLLLESMKIEEDKKMKEDNKKVAKKSLEAEVQLKKEKKGITFEDVSGMEDVKEKLNDVIDQFKNREKYKKFGIKPIRAILLHGVPGTGKSYISTAFANEIDAKFVKVTMGEIGSKYQNATANNIKKIFDDARKEEGNVVLFLDEVDSVASKRGQMKIVKKKIQH